MGFVTVMPLREGRGGGIFLVQSSSGGVRGHLLSSSSSRKDPGLSLNFFFRDGLFLGGEIMLLCV